MLVVLFAPRKNKRRAGPRRGGDGPYLKAPRVGEYWMADVPFRDGTGSKDRPCLVVGTDGEMYTVLYVTSRDRSDNSAFIAINSSSWRGSVASKQSWMQVGWFGREDPRITVHFAYFRRRLGAWSAAEQRSVRAALRELES
ncbi:hypothetical protein ACFSYH_11965 [Populibacterium corticicola]|uniref:Type II toxin-antitoxin system PemK/MazF family toxin n=1 Tax=Populibacterium corticicola TaxID=1812826 RepID=A0ABW5XHC6_9MICO